VKRLRHPVRAIREPFGKAGLTVAILALVMAMVGGAYAAAKLNSTQKKEVERIAKKFAGKPGTNGAPGAAGANGTNGKDGTNGAPGAAGKSVVTSAAPVGSGVGKCEVGGTKLEVEGSGSASVVCNGKNGAIQPGETLPEGATETGMWSVGPITKEATGGSPSTQAPIASFPIPLAAPLDSAHVHYIDPTGEEVLGTAFAPTTQPPGSECEGSVASPSAASGNLCIYAIEEEQLQGASESIFDPGAFAPGAGTVGAFGIFKFEGTLATAVGTWAVTG
jgi:hypothetical protein